VIVDPDFDKACLDHGISDHFRASCKFATGADFPEQHDPPVLRSMQHMIEHFKLLARLYIDFRVDGGGIKTALL
jgi:hypothetical protein